MPELHKPHWRGQRVYFSKGRRVKGRHIPVYQARQRLIDPKEPLMVYFAMDHVQVEKKKTWIEVD